MDDLKRKIEDIVVGLLAIDREIQVSDVRRSVLAIARLLRLRLERPEPKFTCGIRIIHGECRVFVRVDGHETLLSPEMTQAIAALAAQKGDVN